MSLAAAALDLLHRHPGRKRQTTVIRRPDGKSEGEKPTEIIAVAKAYRLKFGANEDYPLHEHYGSTIGQLRLEGSISVQQLWMAGRYAEIVKQNAQLYGIPSPHPRSQDVLMAGGGLSCAADIPDDKAVEIKGKFRDCRRALLDCGQALLVGSQINRVVYGVVVENWPRRGISDRDIQNLRCGLNALERVLRRV